LNQKDSVSRRRRAILDEVESRGFEAVVFFNEVIRQNPGDIIYVLPAALGDEQQTFVMGVNGDTTLVLPHWSAPKVEESGEFSRVIAIRQEKGHHIRGTLEALKPYNTGKVCFDLSTVSAQMAHRMTEELKVPLTPERDISDHVFRLRSIKDEYEIGEIRRAIGITEAAFMMLVEETRPGRSVSDMKRELDSNMIKLGAYEFSFDSSIGFVKGNKTERLKHGDALSLDVGVRVDTGYCSDMGRNWPVTWEKGTGDYMDRAIQAQLEGIKSVREGVTGNQVLARANEINAELGFEPMPRTGHQIGLDVHDYTMPYATNFGEIEEDNLPLKAGMTLTYEPQRRDPKTGYKGHIEDIVLVTKGDPVCLNQMPYRLTW
jgi:Xaa-Pro aminopeptidase